jgi:DNA primase
MATAVAPRLRDGATVPMPLAWERFNKRLARL